MSTEHSTVSLTLGIQGWPKASLFLVLMKLILMVQETDWKKVNRGALWSKNAFCGAKEAGRWSERHGEFLRAAPEGFPRKPYWNWVQKRKEPTSIWSPDTGEEVSWTSSTSGSVTSCSWDEEPSFCSGADKQALTTNPTSINQEVCYFP